MVFKFGLFYKLIHDIFNLGVKYILIFMVYLINQVIILIIKFILS